eukprot:scaffold133330_cov109-Phaeocystis_antarctica.AAC.1
MAVAAPRRRDVPRCRVRRPRDGCSNCATSPNPASRCPRAARAQRYAARAARATARAPSRQTTAAPRAERRAHRPRTAC